MPIKLNNESLQKSIDQFNNLNLRLRVMLTIAMSAVLFMLFDLIWYSNEELNINKIKHDVSQLVKQSDNLITLQQEMNTTITNEKNNISNTKLKILNDEVISTYKQLEKKTENLVKPEDMAGVLKNIILSSKELKIEMLSKNKTEEIVSSENKEIKEPKNNSVKLYKHSVEMVLSGSYSSTYQLLINLETMKKKVSFDSFEYSVKKHPLAEIKLTVSTISLQREWIGG